MKKLSIFLILFSALQGNIFACLYASQNRIFPLGKTSQGLVVIESRISRAESRNGDYEEDWRPYWGGVSYYRIYDSDHHIIYSELIDTIELIEQKLLDTVLEKHFQKGLKIAQKQIDFQIAKPLSIAFAGYEYKYDKIKLSYNEPQEQILIKLENQQKYPINVLFDTASIASNHLGYFFGGLDSKVYVEELKNSILINSIRHFQIGDKILTVTHLGYGSFFDPKAEKKELKELGTTIPFNDINQSVYLEPVLHHGHGFDFFIWE